MAKLLAGTSSSSSSIAIVVTNALLLLLLICCGAITAQAQQLSPGFYDQSCPTLQTVVRAAMAQAVAKEPRMAASFLRLFFHDCFVQGCDASILLDDTATFTGEKGAGPNANSARGFDVIDTIKASVEAVCKNTVSCADILALATRDGVNLLGGPTWVVPLGRRDSLTASAALANANLPGPGSSLSTLISMFKAQGFTADEMTVLSGAHTIGQAQCVFFRSRIYGGDKNINATFARTRQQTCPRSGGDSNLAPIDVRTPASFDSGYFVDLMQQSGLFHSDQELFNGGSQDALVRRYAGNQAAFFADFAKAMVKLSSVSPLTGSNGQIRLNCRKVN